MNKKSARIFLVEDDVSFGSVLKSYWRSMISRLTWLMTARWRQRRSQGVYDLCILDVMLPHVDGFTIASEIRVMNSVIPIIFLTAKKLKKTAQGIRRGR
jgi:DNA-binding response OmpR family regulator